MPRSLALLVALAVALVSSSGISAAWLSVERTQESEPGNGPTVVLVSLDGFPAAALRDPALPIPNLRRLAADGAIADGLRSINPVVTWPNHTSFVTGVGAARHQVLYNGLLVRPGAGLPPQVEPWRDKREMVRATTVYDKAHEKGLTTAQVDWVAIQNPGTITWAFPERPDPDGVVERELIEAGLVSREDLAAFSERPVLWRDHIWTEAGMHILARHRPNLLLFHLLNTDSTHHHYGHNSPAGFTALAHADAQLGRLVRTVEATGRVGQTTFIVVSDHGFKQVRRQVRPNAALREAGLLAGTDAAATEGPTAYTVTLGGMAMVYATRGSGAAWLGRVKPLLSSLEGVARIVEPDEYGALGMPLPSESDQVGDLLLVAADGYAFSSVVDGPVVVDALTGGLGAHGYLNSDPEMGAIFVAAGRGIRRGARLGWLDAPDVGGILASLLGVDMGAIDGRVPDALFDGSSN